MINDIVEKCKEFIEISLETLKNVMSKINGSEKRILLAEIAESYGHGGQTYISKEFGVSRDVIRKGTYELETGMPIEDKYANCGRKPITEKLPNLENDIKSIVEVAVQTDPKFQSERLYVHLTVKEIRKQLIEKYGYINEELPTNMTLNTLINKFGYTLKKVKKTKPLKRIKETNGIFTFLNKTHEKYKDDTTAVRLSIDAKDRVKIGDFSRGGKNRNEIKANDHDFGGEFITPFGIMNVDTNDIEIYMAESKVTADFIVDRIENYWERYCNDKTTLILNADNGPENSSSRTEFIKRMIEFSAKYNVEVILAYYPPYYSKYNKIERVWGHLEMYWNGELLDTKEAVIGFASNMTYNGKNPIVTLIDKVYDTGVKVEKKIMGIYESAIDRLKGLEKWFVRITPKKCKEILTLQNLM